MSASWKSTNPARRASRKLQGSHVDLRKPPDAAEKRALTRHKSSIAKIMSGDASIGKARSAKSFASLKGAGAKPLRGHRFLVTWFENKTKAAKKYGFKGNPAQQIRDAQQFVLDAFARHDRCLASPDFETAEERKLPDAEYREAVHLAFVYFGDDERVRRTQDRYTVTAKAA